MVTPRESLGENLKREKEEKKEKRWGQEIEEIKKKRWGIISEEKKRIAFCKILQDNLFFHSSIFWGAISFF